MSVKPQAVLLVIAAGDHSQDDLNAVVAAANAAHDASLLQLAWEARTAGAPGWPAGSCPWLRRFIEEVVTMA